MTLYIDLIGFSIIFPLVPDILTHYLAVEGQNGILGALVVGSESVAGWLGKDRNFAAVLLGGVLGQGAYTFRYAEGLCYFSAVAEETVIGTAKRAASSKNLKCIFLTLEILFAS